MSINDYDYYDNEVNTGVLTPPPPKKKEPNNN